MERVDVEVAVIGAGFMGLSIARSLVQNGYETAVFDSESSVASITSSRNSGVLHGGIYYPSPIPEQRPGLKALYSVAGRRLLYRRAHERGIPYDNCGKLIVATAREQIDTLRAYQINAEKNGVGNTWMLSAAEVAEMEPEVFCHKALYVPQSGLIDTHEYAATLDADITNGGGVIMLGTKAVKGNATGGRIEIETEGEQKIKVVCRALINAAGLGAQEFSRNLAGLNPLTIPEQRLGKGNYFKFAGPRPFKKKLIYPLPAPGTSGLHARNDLGGGTVFGPDLEWVDRINYDVNLGRREFFENAIRAYWPGLPAGALQPDYAGIRSKIILPPGHPLEGDFMIQGPRQHGVPNYLALYGMNSPGLTASFAIGPALVEAFLPTSVRKDRVIPDFPLPFNLMHPTPIIILVEPQLVENIGMTARAMMNCGLAELRIVDPRDPWPLHEIMEERMMGAASGADEILRNAKLFDTLPEAIADLHYVYATAARTHDMVNRILTPRAAIPDMIARMTENQKVGVMFGRERTGLVRDQIALASAKITIPLNPEFSSLNLAQAVLLIGYEWYQAHDKTPDRQIHMGASRPAERHEYINFFQRLEAELEARGFFVAGDMRPGMVRSLTNMLQRAEMTEQEIRTWHGVLSALIKEPGPNQTKKTGNQ